MAPLDVRDAVTETLARFKPQIRERAFDVECHASDQPCKVTGDCDAIIQALENVIDNAIKYSENTRKIVIRIFKRERSVILSITDSGKGIPQGDIPHVFTKFYRGKNAGRDGSGLGLSVVHKILKDHGGSVAIDSLTDRGTSVTLIFPSE